MIIKIQEMQKVTQLFGDWQETLIWSCLQKVMGAVYADNPEDPQAAMTILGDFCCFAGRPDRELVRYKPEGCKQEFIIMVPQNEAWGKLIEACYGDSAKKVSRYAFKKEPDVFDEEKLRQAADALPDGYELKLVDEACYNMCQEEAWSRDLVSQFSDYDTYRKMGLGVVAVQDGRIVSGASSYSRYRDGIEIEIDTEPGHRRKGLAYACGARLILECIKRNLYPSWDAQNLWSVALAEKLGYHFDHEYTAYEIWKWL